MIVYLNGRFLPEQSAAISIHDRGFLYGDGLFEAIRVYDGKPFLWEDHIERFRLGCEILRISSPLSPNELLVFSKEVLRRNQVANGLLRITLSRGPGSRGYSPKGADYPTLLIAVFPPPELPLTYRVIISATQLPYSDPLAIFKVINKVRQVLARAEADDAGANEALLLDSRGFVVEGTTTNLFWVKEETVFTPPLGGILRGTTRGHILRLCQTLNIPAREKNIRAADLRKADGLFVTSCGAEVMEVSHLDGKRVPRSPVVRKLKRNYREEF
jgi:branched-chain amino acid aminotransferase